MVDKNNASVFTPILIAGSSILLISFAITDFIIGYHTGTHWTWGSVLIIGLISRYLSNSIFLRMGGALFGAFMDIALVVSAVAVSIRYLIEIDSVCLIDLMSGERARIMAETLKAEIEFAETMGLPKPDTVEDPKCVSTT